MLADDEWALAGTALVAQVGWAGDGAAAFRLIPVGRIAVVPPVGDVPARVALFGEFVASDSTSRVCGPSVGVFKCRRHPAAPAVTLTHDGWGFGPGVWQLRSSPKPADVG